MGCVNGFAFNGHRSVLWHEREYGIPMGKYKALARNAAIISIGTILSKLVAFFMVRFYTGMLTPAQYGTGDLLITAVSLLMPFVSFGIGDGVFRFLPEYPDDAKSVFSIGIYTVTAGIAVLAALLTLMHWAGILQEYVPLLAFMVLSACYHSVCTQYVRASGNTVLFAEQGLLNTLLVVALNLLLLTVFRLGVAGYVLSVGLADLLSALFLIVAQRLWRYMTVHPNRELLKKMLHYSVPLIPTTVFWWITSVSDRYMISAMLGQDANGIYTVANKLPTMLTLLSGVLMQAWQYSAVSEAKSSPKEQAEFYSNVWLALLSALFLTCSAMVALTKIEIRLLADSSYGAAWLYMPVLCTAMLFCSFNSFMGSVYTVTQQSKLSLWTSLLGATINIVLNLLLIPSPLGIQGAALATLVSYLVVFLVRAENVRHFIAFRLFKKELLLSTVILIVQITFICFALPGWKGVQLVAIASIFLIGRMQIAGKISSFRTHTVDN